MDNFCKTCTLEYDYSEPENICKICGNPGSKVSGITIENMIINKGLVSSNYEEFYFCKTSDCDIVYFSNIRDIYIEKKDIKVRVGIKENKPPIPVCYCFNITREDIISDIKENKSRSLIKFVENKINNGECSCEIKNPSGKCCLNEIKRIYKYYKLINE